MASRSAVLIGNEKAQEAQSARAVFWGICEYREALRRMDEAQRDRRDGAIPDTIFYLEHEPVITHGRATPTEHLHRTDHGIPTFEVPRGGLATYHGPGQLVGYPIINLANRTGGRRADIHDYLRALERALVSFLRDECQLAAGTRKGLTGVWIEDAANPRKIASIGVSARRWVTAHGFALNINPDLGAFRAIVPCGLEGDPMTSVENEFALAGRAFAARPMKDVAGELHRFVCAALREQGWGGETRES
ncbi:MAG: lipoyl(octanoyl) transferase LipB [Candidatus Sumerlaeaceae bacterium]|nr:lipoyl(octanoyl) transferase LipB [Candidatus Sumerlaeaceae bacterium]